MFESELKLRPDGLTSESTKHYRKKLYRIVYKFFQKSEEERTTFQIILWGLHYSDTNIKDSNNKIKKIMDQQMQKFLKFQQIDSNNMYKE